MRVIVQQRLLPKIGGGRHAVREHLAFDDPMRAELLRAREKDLPLLLAAMTREKGQTLLQAAEKAEAEGLVPQAAVSAIRQERGK